MHVDCNDFSTLINAFQADSITAISISFKKITSAESGGT